MEGNAVNQRGKDRLVRIFCDVVGVLLALLFLAGGLCLFGATVLYIGTYGGHINSAIGCALGAATLLLQSICLALPTKLYEDKRLCIAGKLTASMTSAATVASVILPLVVLVLICIVDPPSPGSPAADGGGVVLLICVVIGLAGILVFLPCTCILARKAKVRLAHLAIGTVVAGVAGGLLGYLCY